MSNNKLFDSVFVGAGIINILEASNHKLNKKKVLIIESKNRVSGAWSPINILGYSKIENAIHYFMPSVKGINFLNNLLNNSVILQKSKYKIIFVFGRYIKIDYHNRFGDLLWFLSSPITFTRTCGKWPPENFFKTTINTFKKIFLSMFLTKRSYYMKNGIIDLNAKILKLIKELSLKINLKEKIIKVSLLQNKVKIITNKGTYYSKKLYISHGGDAFKLEKKDGELKIIENIHSRPSIHILIENVRDIDYQEAIICNDKNIKYVHDITDYAKINNNLNKMNILVLGLKDNVKNSYKLRKEILETLKKFDYISKFSTIIDYHWQDIILPKLYTDDLINLEKKSSGMIEFIFSENFTEGIAKREKNWFHLKNYLNIKS